MEKPPLPRLFVAVASKRWLWILAAVTLISGAAMLPATATMADHGTSVLAFESAGGAARSQEILTEWGDAGRTAAWWQLGLDLPFLIGYGLFLAGACAAVAGRAREAGKPRLERVATVAAWFGPLAASLDLLQNISLALVLNGPVEQPWPRIAAVTVPFIFGFAIAAAIVAIAGALATRSSQAAAHGLDRS